MDERKQVHVERIPIRWGDMDAMGHVNNTVYFRYMEQARIGWFEGLLPSDEAWRSTGIVIANASCNFKRALNYPGTVEVRVLVGRAGRLERADLLRALAGPRALRRRSRHRGLHRHAGAAAGAHSGKDPLIAALKPLWSPSPERAASTELARFMARAGRKSYDELHAWSIEKPEEFWSLVWDFGAVRGSRAGPVLVDGTRMPGAQWFPQARLNFAHNLLRRRDDGEAIVFWGEDRVKRRLTHRNLYDLVSRMAQALADAGVGKGDRVAGYLPNVPEATAAMLATASLGAIWSSCSPDFGVQGVLDRFGQIEPKVLFCADGYLYNGKEFDSQEKALAALEKLPSVEECVVVDYLGGAARAGTALDEFVEPFDAEEMRFEPVEFNHPLYILYSSGTTGVPKCIVHGTGGTLLQHLKEHRLQSDVRSGDRLFYFTTLGWMMWNWLVSGLASDATLLLYDGSPSIGRGKVIFDFAEATRHDAPRHLGEVHRCHRQGGLEAARNPPPRESAHGALHRLAAPSRGLRLRLPGGQERCLPLVDLRRHRYRLLLCARQSHGPGVARRDPGEGPGHGRRGFR